MPDLNHRELATVLAALRLWQASGEFERAASLCVATDADVEALSVDEIDVLCERLNRQ